MALGKFGPRDWLAGFLNSVSPNADSGSIYVPAVTLVDSSGNSAQVGVMPVGVTESDHSISAATGASQLLRPLSTTSNLRKFINSSATIWYLNPQGGLAASSGPNIITLNPGDGYYTNARNSVTGLGTANATLVILES